MPRKGEVPKRQSIPDPKYTEAPVDVRKRLTKFMNTVMLAGKKLTAENIVYKSFDLVAQRASDDPLKIWMKALDNIKPKVEVKSRRVGGANYQVPVEVTSNRRMALGNALARFLRPWSRREDDGRQIGR